MRARLLGGLGALLTLVAGAVVVSPDLAASLSAVVSALESQGPERLLLVLGAAVGLYAAWAARTGTPERSAVEGPAARFEGANGGNAPETVSAADRVLTGEALDDRIAAACEGDDRALRAVRSNLAATAASARARSADRTPEQARREVRSGAWTDDDIAAALLADEEGPDFPLLARLRAWLDPETERQRRIDRTIGAVERIFENRGGDGATSPDDGGDDPEQEADR
ncbi:DUF7269 family protein [Halorussus ruber]|uniref:DUF7269 family protein n=1 Tax=Halorussus ruber TaxID=1126238 RepID=UPI001091F7C7|nr:hypothetical protein [Halorussus ruber]